MDLFHWKIFGDMLAKNVYYIVVMDGMVYQI